MRMLLANWFFKFESSIHIRSNWMTSGNSPTISRLMLGIVVLRPFMEPIRIYMASY